jgi:hypothetical protein
VLGRAVLGRAAPWALPAPAPAPVRPTLRPVSGQLSFLTAGTQPPAVADLEGLLLGMAQLVRLGGTARMSVLVDGQWRVGAVLAAYEERGLRGETASTLERHTAVRTPFVRTLLPLAERWVRGAVKAVPARWSLDGTRLRLWAIAAGQADEHGYLLRLGHSDIAVWEPAGAALAAAGLPASFVGARTDGPAYRLVGRRRMARLREYIGEPPDGAPAGGWPG